MNGRARARARVKHELLMAARMNLSLVPKLIVLIEIVD